MKVRHLKVKNYRGIKELEWKIDGDVICLVGGGDNTKSTILKAISAALSPRWNHSFTDCDFYNLDIAQSIEIVVTVGDLSDECLRKFHDYYRGLNNQGQIVAMPTQNVETVVSIKLTVDSSLEPTWSIFSEPTLGNIEERTVSAKERELLGVSELGKYLDRELSWGYGSSVSKMTGDRSDVITAFRSARGAVIGGQLVELETVASTLETKSQNHGVTPTVHFKPDLDLEQLSMSAGVLCISDGEVPLRLKGLGTRRLVALAAQRESVNGAGILLVDEVESGLEPFRLRHLLNELKKWATPSQQQTDQITGQVFLTTHSSVSIVQLQASDIYIVKKNSHDKITIEQVHTSLQATLRNNPEALLARKVIVCEGKTEYGLCLALDKHWFSTGSPCWAYLGVVPTVGGGNQAALTAKKFRSLGYDVAYFGDSDVAISPTRQELEREGITVIQWSDNVEIEERACRDLPWTAVTELFTKAVDEKGSQSICDRIKTELIQKGVAVIGSIPSDLETMKQTYTELVIRQVLGKIISDTKIFKRIDLGEEFGNLLVRYLPQVSGTNLYMKINELKIWTTSVT